MVLRVRSCCSHGAGKAIRYGPAVDADERWRHANRRGQCFHLPPLPQGLLQALQKGAGAAETPAREPMPACWPCPGGSGRSSDDGQKPHLQHRAPRTDRSNRMVPDGRPDHCSSFTPPASRSEYGPDPGAGWTMGRSGARGPHSNSWPKGGCAGGCFCRRRLRLRRPEKQRRCMGKTPCSISLFLCYNDTNLEECR